MNCGDKPNDGSAIWIGMPGRRVEGVEADVCRDIAARQAVGLRKYGRLLSENPAQHRERLQHAYEEALDLACYLKWAMSQLPESHAPSHATRA